MEPCIATHSTDSGTQPLTLTPQERWRHLYVVGRSGSGKSTLLYNLALSDILAGHGVTVIDPHGDLIEDLLDTIPPERTEDVCYLNVADAQAVGFNPFAHVPPERLPLAASGILSAFKGIWGDVSWGPRLEHFLNFAIALLLERPGSTFLDLPPLFYDKRFRAKMTSDIKDDQIKEFWLREYPSYNDRYREDAQGSILNKARQFIASPHIRRIISQKHPKFEIARAMDTRQIVLVNLCKGLIGSEPAHLLGSLIVSHLKTVALARADRPKEDRTEHRVFVDEFQSLGTTAFADILSEARKYGLSLVLAHQFTQQIHEEVRAAVLGNVGTLIAFRVGVEDARLLKDEFHPLPPSELSDQFPFYARIKRLNLSHSQIVTQPPQPAYRDRRNSVIAASRRRFSRKLPHSRHKV